MLKTLMRLALILVGCLLLLLALVLLLLQTPMANTMVENRLRAWVHPALQVNGGVQVSVLPRLGVDLRDVIFPSRQGAYPALSIKQWQFQVSWPALFERTLSVEDFYVQGVEIFRSGQSWAPLIEDLGQSPVFDHDLEFDWVQIEPRAEAAWRLVIKQALVENVSVFGTEGQAGQLALATLGQLEFKTGLNWPDAVGSQMSLGLRQLSVNHAEEFGHTPALLEQLGIASNGVWDVMAMDSQWEVQESKLGQRVGQVLLLRSLTADGAWGELSAANGQLDLVTGQVAIPMQATLTNAPKFKSRALEINVHQSRMRFELTGTITDPGVQWISQPASSR